MSDLLKQAYEELYEKQDEFFGALSCALSAFVDAVITDDRCGAVTFMNISARALTGWTLVDAKGKRLNVVFDIVGENAQSVLQYPAEDSTGLSVTLSEGTYLKSKDGTQHYVQGMLGTDRTDGADRCGVVIFREVHKKRQGRRRWPARFNIFLLQLV